MVKRDIGEVLERIGLTEYGAKIYLALVKHGPQGAKEIASRSGVPKNRVYDRMDELEDRGFVEIIPGKPKKYRAVNPRMVLEGYLDDLERTKEELEELYEKSKEEKESSIKITYGKKSAVQARLLDFSLAKNKYSAIVGLKGITTPRLGMIDREAKKAKERGAEIRFLLNMDYKGNKEKAEFLGKFGIKYKHFPGKDFVLAILDEKTIRIEVPDPEKERINIWIENKDLAKKLQKWFDEEWNKRKLYK